MILVIEITEEDVKKIEKIKFLVGGKEDRLLQSHIINAIKNGKSLSEILYQNSWEQHVNMLKEIYNDK